MEQNLLLQEINAQSPAAFLQSAKKRGWVCPVCGNGSGKDGDGLVKNPKTGKYKCFKCGLGGDILDLIGAVYHLDSFPEQLDKAKELYSLTEKPLSSSLAVNPVRTELQEPLEDYFAACRNRVSETDFFTCRGLSVEIVTRFGLGYDPDFSQGTGSHHWQAAILPTSPNSFEARNVAVAPNDPEQGRNKYRKQGKAVLFNAAALSDDRPVFVCEGILDALSVMECGGTAVALGSAVNYPLLLSALDDRSPALPLILLLDGDATGRENTNKLTAALETRGLAWLDGAAALGCFHDPNDRLLKDREGLTAGLALLGQKAAALPDPQEERRLEYERTSAGACLTDFLAAITRDAARPHYSTGFKNLDSVLGGGLFPGLYVLGAISSLGKTTLVLQIADALAQQGQDVLFFSLEQSRYELMSKSLSRESLLWCRETHQPDSSALTGRMVLNGENHRSPVLFGAVEKYRQYADHLFFYEGVGCFSVEEIARKLRDHISLTGSRPVVVVDYLQILKPAEADRFASDKQVVDRNVTALKQLSRDFDLPVLAVSSLNRASYSERVTMSAFKESGAIEYGSDVLLGLQMSGVGEPGFDQDKARASAIRRVDLCVLKNRSGETTGTGLKLRYDTRFNLFEE